MSAQQTTFDTLDLPNEQDPEPLTINYTDITTEQDLIKYSQQYAARAITQHDIDVNQARITHWEVSTRATRRAAAVISVNIQKSTPLGIRTTIGKHIDWDKIINHENNLNQKISRSSKFPMDDVRNVGMTLSWKAFQSFDEQEWQSTIRHELVHVEQYQKYGKSDHGRRFTNRAEDLDTENHCPKFYEGQYLLVCTDCGDVTSDRVKRSKYVKMADPNHPEPNTLKSKCCGSSITLEMNDNAGTLD